MSPPPSTPDTCRFLAHPVLPGNTGGAQCCPSSDLIRDYPTLRRYTRSPHQHARPLIALFCSSLYHFPEPLYSGQRHVPVVRQQSTTTYRSVPAACTTAVLPWTTITHPTPCPVPGKRCAARPTLPDCVRARQLYDDGAGWQNAMTMVRGGRRR